MVKLATEQFAEFFEALWSEPDKVVTPFAWQQELARRVITNTSKPWPDAIALPTASGKTACIDIAVFALATQAERLEGGNSFTAPRRIFFVVDRRVIVDEAFNRARQLAKRLREAKQGILKDVADRLRKLADGTEPLACYELRGGMYRSDAWAKSPLQPAIIASTVDQIGSRLLFRGYGHSFKAWPIQAGLVGNDSLILLDEAHCAQPFLETLQSVRKYRDWAKIPLGVPFHMVIMSATPPQGLQDVFYDESDEPKTKGHSLGNRQLAKKNTTLKIGRNISHDLVGCAEAIVRNRPLAAVIFVNRVATAREAHRLLVESHGNNAILLTGRMRPIDKDDTVTERLKRLSAGNSEHRQLDAPIFVVATQTLEVGADLDFDALVTECASLDALRQRFGRLNRMGRPIEASAAILIRDEQTDGNEDDPIYGAALANTWKWLKEKAENGEIDMGISALASRLPTDADLADLNAPTNHAPVMLPAHVDCWAQTAPEPKPTPDVSIFLHGLAVVNPDIQVCWRADLDLSTDEGTKQSLDVLSLCPPTVPECLSVPIGIFRRWLMGDPQAIDDSDVEGQREAKEDTDRDRVNEEIRKVLRWRGKDDANIVSEPGDIHPGDTIVIPTSLKGWDTLGDLPPVGDRVPVLDWGDRAYSQIRAKAMLRLHPAVIEQWMAHDAEACFIEIAHQATDLFEEDLDALVDQLRKSLNKLSKDTSAPEWLRKIAASLATDRMLKQGISLHPLGGLVLRGSRRLPVANEDTDRFSDEDDATASGTVPVPLEKHLEGVADLAENFGVGCGLRAELVDAISKAGRLHDTGKADPRFQAILHGGNRWVKSELLAKSAETPQSYAAYKRACETTGYPKDGRHELLSLRFAESELGLLPEDKTLRDLALHLIESHHGRCRPFAPVVLDKEPITVNLPFQGCILVGHSNTELEQLDSGASERFWRLTRCYGWWGLAWLESILRLADHRRSEAEEMEYENEEASDEESI